MPRESNATPLDQFNLSGFIRGDTRGRVKRDRIPGNLNTSRRYVVMLEELANSVRAVHFEAVIGGPVGLQKAMSWKAAQIKSNS
jgi:hypothetical protein